MKYILFFSLLLTFSFNAKAQTASQMDAAYLAVIKAVADYKIDDEQQEKNIEALRQDEKFNQKLEKMLSKLNNNKAKFGANKRVYEILVRAGKNIYQELK